MKEDTLEDLHVDGLRQLGCQNYTQKEVPDRTG